MWHIQAPSLPLLTLQGGDGIFESDTRPRVRALIASGQVCGVAFSRGGRQLACACEAGLTLYEAAGAHSEHMWSDAVEVALLLGLLLDSLCFFLAGLIIFLPGELLVSFVGSI